MENNKKPIDDSSCLMNPWRLVRLKAESQTRVPADAGIIMSLCLYLKKEKS